MKFITLGSDPEFFVHDDKGHPFPATAFAKGTKDEPVPIENLGKGFFEQRDNLSFEGNIPKCATREAWIDNMTRLRNYFCDKVELMGYKLSPNGVEYFSKRYLRSLEGMEFGCSNTITSWDSMQGDYVKRPTPNLSKLNYRVAGFHIHIGYDLNDLPFKDKRDVDLLVGRLFDIFLTIPSHVIKPEPERIKTYGKWGMVRMKSYGVECRTLSSYFTQSEWLGWVWDQVMKIQDFINEADTDDLEILIKYRHFLGDTSESATKIFNGLFSHFTNKEVLNKFNETKDTINEKYKTSFRIS
jgi:hypothetical protein